MTKIYFKNAQVQKVVVEVTEEVAAGLKETRNAIWANDAYEDYYRDRELSGNLNDKDAEFGNDDSNPEMMMVAAEDIADRRAKLLAALKELTPKQLRLVKMLKAGMSVTEIAARLNCSKPTISKMKKAIQKIFESFL